MEKMKQHCKSGGRYGVGALLIIAGLVILASNLNLIPYYVSDILISWPMLFVAIGLINLIKKEFTAAVIFLAIGGYFILPDIFPYWSHVNIWKFWPILLIIVGLAFISHRRRAMHPRMSESSSIEGIIDEVAIFGGRVTRVESNDFAGGKVTCVFGGCELHLEKAEMSPEGAILDVTAIFGGTKIIVPKEWNVKVEVVSILGGFADKRLYATEQSKSGKTLVIKGTTIFGGGELSNI